jgi:hypothetical protein
VQHLAQTTAVVEEEAKAAEAAVTEAATEAAAEEVVVVEVEEMAHLESLSLRRARVLQNRRAFHSPSQADQASLLALLSGLRFQRISSQSSPMERQPANATTLHVLPSVSLSTTVRVGIRHWATPLAATDPYSLPRNTLARRTLDLSKACQ